MSDYVTKPFNTVELLARIKTHLCLRKKSDLLEQLASLDGLTDIPNRRAFDETLDREWYRAQLESGSLSVIFIDIDHFKNFNDTYGHASGDDCLVKVAHTLQSSLNRHPVDFVARYGGEEFVVILPNTVPHAQNSPSSLLKVADKCLYEAKSKGRNKVTGKKLFGTADTLSTSQ